MEKCAKLVHSALPTRVVITCDRWFGNYNWVATHQDIAITFAVATGREEKLAKVFHHNLPKNCFRVFKKGDVLCTAWHDKDCLLTMSTVFQCSTNLNQPDVTDRSKRPAPVSNLTAAGAKPELSEHAMHILTTLNIDDLKSLARRLGYSQGILHVSFEF